MAKKAKTPQAPTAQAEQPLVMGFGLKPELRNIELASVIDPKGTPDRIPGPEDDQQIAELARSIREVGQLNPIMVEQLADGRYCRVFGRRRLAAMRLAGLATIAALIVPPLPDDVRRSIVAIENMQRKDLTAAEEHLAVGELMKLKALEAAAQSRLWLPHIQRDATSELVAEIRRVGADAFEANSNDALLDPKVRSATVDMVSAMLAKSRQWVLDRLYVSRLGKKGQQLIREGRLPLPHAREIAKMADPSMREELAVSYAAGGCDSLSEVEAGSLEDLKDAVSRNVFTLRQVPWVLDKPVAGKRACEGCEHNSATNPGLFDASKRDEQVSTEMRAGRGAGAWASDKRDIEAGVCTLPACYQAKLITAKSLVTLTAKKIADGKDVPIPPLVTKAAVTERVSGMKKRGKTKSHKPSPKAEAEELRRQAKEKRDAAMVEIGRKIYAAAAKILNGIPLACAYLHLWETHFQKTNSVPPEVIAKAAKATREDFNALVERFLKLKHQQRPDDCWRRDQAERAVKVAAVLGIEHDPLPELKDFLPKKDAKPAAKKGKKS